MSSWSPRSPRRSPTLTVVLVGPQFAERGQHAPLAARANVTSSGRGPYDDVPAYLQHADVVIVPHVVTPFTESLDPIKAYECAAVGRPTLVTPVPGFDGLGPAIETAEATRSRLGSASWSPTLRRRHR